MLLISVGMLSIFVVSNVKFYVAALRNVEKYLGLEKLYILGTNCGKFSQSLS